MININWVVRTYPSPVPKTKELQPWMNLSGTNLHSACSRLQDSRDSRSRKVAQNRKRAGQRQEREPVSIVFNTLFRYTSSSVYQSIWLVNFDSWRQQCLRARRVRKTQCKTLLHHTFWHENFFFLEVCWLVGEKRYFKDAYRLSPFLFPPFFAVPPNFSLVCFDHRERGTG